MAARVVPVPPFDLVVFGGTGDLARRKLLPALYQRLRAGQMTDESLVLIVGRSELTTEAYRTQAREMLEKAVNAKDLDTTSVARFLGCLDYRRADAACDDDWDNLTTVLQGRADRARAFYMAVEPRLFSPICERIAAHSLLTDTARLVVEKPLGHDLPSARALNMQLSSVFNERNLYRIDHYLGKETVQNLMALRFANALFEPLWNARHVDHVQITVAESVGVEGRSAYYDKAGAMRDMVQNHLLQLLCLMAMEPPNRFEPDALRDEKLKVLRALEPITPASIDTCAVRGQYKARNGITGYLEDCGNPHSTTESYVALKVGVANWRWSRTPFYLRTGKRLPTRMSEIALVFKDAPHSIFAPEAGNVRGNALIIRLQPDEGIMLRLTIKEPGPGGMRLIEVPLNMTFASSLGIDGRELPDAYERLVMDVIRGDQTLFMRSDEVEAAWSWVDPIIDAWAQSGDRPQSYPAGGSGPEDAQMLIHRDGRRWREIEA